MVDFGTPDRSDDVKRVDAAYPSLLLWNSRGSCAEFLQRVLVELNEQHPDEQWGHIHKDSGESGYTFPNGVRVSYDVVMSRTLHRQVDIVSAAGAHPAPGGAVWQPIDPAVYRPGNVWVPPFGTIFNSDAPDEVATTVARIGRGFFGLLRGIQDDPEWVEAHGEWFAGEEGTEVYRIFLDLEGEMHAGSLPDPWRDAGIDGRQGNWPDLMRRACEFALRYNAQLHCTVYGGNGHFRTLDERRRFHDRIVSTIGGAGLWHAIYGFHMMNEFNVNGFSVRDVQQAGEDLFSKVPAGLALSLSSPAGSHGLPANATNEEIQASFEHLYGRAGEYHYGANTIDIHISRDQSSKWADPIAYNFILPELAKTNHEPFGQYSSVWWTNAPNTIVAAYARTSQAGYRLYVGHNAWCAWGGRLPVEHVAALERSYGSEYAYGHTIRNVWDMPNQKAVSNGSRQHRESGEVPGGGGGNGGGGGGTSHSELRAGQRLYPERSEFRSPGGRAHMHYQGDGNLVIYHDGKPVWASQTAGTEPGYVEMQHDGNFVMYDGDGNPIRHTNTAGHPGAMIQLQDDGNFVMYEDPKGPHAGTPIWASASSPLYDAENDIIQTR